MLAFATYELKSTVVLTYMHTTYKSHHDLSNSLVMARSVMARMCPPYPQRVVKRD